jgi:chemotaxis protein CheX
MISSIDQIEVMTREAVQQVFSGMLSMDLKEEPAGSLPADAKGQVAGSVGFVGKGSGVIYLYAGATSAVTLASRMLGIPEAEIEGDEMVNDVVGELTNMVCGSVKSKLCDGGWPCKLTIPSVVRARELSVGGVAHVQRRVLGFHNGEHHVLAEILLKEGSN